MAMDFFLPYIRSISINKRKIPNQIMIRGYTGRKSQRTGVFEEDEEGELCSMPRKAHKQYGIASGDKRKTIITSITFIE